MSAGGGTALTRRSFVKGAAAAAAALAGTGRITAEDEVVLFNTGSGLKYVGMEPAGRSDQ